MFKILASGFSFKGKKKGGFVPVVEVKWLEGRNAEQKKKLIEGIFRVFEESGVKKENLQVIIEDVPKTNWGMDGKPASEK